MTEAQAKKKWCPFTRLAFGNTGDNGTINLAPVACNRVAPEGKDEMIYGKCIASDCMAWRWSGPCTGRCGLAGTTAR